jgi:putative FmdB family regulatory protein
MPLYEYSCNRCGRTFEVMQKFSDEPLVTHEGCGGAVERLLSAPALQFKGSGWYITDYARNGKGSATNGDQAKSESKSDKSESKSESKAKSETKPANPAPASDK